MTEWTGVLYGFYTNKPIEFVFKQIQTHAQEIGYRWDYREYNDEKTLLFYKNQEMLDHHLENGYNTDLDGEGCFGIEAKSARLHGMASLFEFEGSSDFKPYDIHLAFDDIVYYVVILPELIEESYFSKKIYQLVTSVL